jgi:hypothetical protein
MKIDIKIDSKDLKFDKGQLIVLISTAVAFISLFFPWVSAGFISVNAFQIQTFLIMLLYILPVYQVFKRRRFFLDPNHNFIVEVGSGALAAFLTLIFILTRTTFIFGHSVNLAASGSYVFLLSSLALTYGSYLDYQKSK